MSGRALGLGVIGLGMAGAVMVRAAARHPGVVLVAAADPHAAPREAFGRDHNAKTYADAHRADPELYRFTRSLESLNKLVTKNTNLILRTDSEPFSLLQSKDAK